MCQSPGTFTPTVNPAYPDNGGMILPDGRMLVGLIQESVTLLGDGTVLLAGGWKPALHVAITKYLEQIAALEKPNTHRKSPRR